VAQDTRSSIFELVCVFKCLEHRLPNNLEVVFAGAPIAEGGTNSGLTKQKCWREEDLSPIAQIVNELRYSSLIRAVKRESNDIQTNRGDQFKFARGRVAF
jgi:hypothetical protein